MTDFSFNTTLLSVIPSQLIAGWEHVLSRSALLPGSSAPPAVGCTFLSSETCMSWCESDRSRHASSWPMGTKRSVRLRLWPGHHTMGRKERVQRHKQAVSPYFSNPKWSAVTVEIPKWFDELNSSKTKPREVDQSVLLLSSYLLSYQVKH